MVLRAASVFAAVLTSVPLLPVVLCPPLLFCAALSLVASQTLVFKTCQVGEPMEGGVGATTHSAHNQKGGWGRGGDALGAGEEGDTEEGHQRMLGADDRREGGDGGGKKQQRRDSTRGWARKDSCTGEPMGQAVFFCGSHFF